MRKGQSLFKIYNNLNTGFCSNNSDYDAYEDICLHSQLPIHRTLKVKSVNT